MALILDYVVPNTGLTIPNAYHIIHKVDVEKRTQNIQSPVDTSRPEGVTEPDFQSEENAVLWKAGYVAKVTIVVYANKEARENGLEPVGWIGSSPTDAPMDSNFGQQWKGFEPMFMLDTSEGAPTELVQAYSFLKSTPHFANAIED